MDKGFRKKLLNNDKNTKKSNLSFLLNILQKFEESEQNSQVLEKLLRENVDKLEDEHLAQDLYCWTMKRLCSATPIQARLMAIGLNNFSRIIQNFPLGNMANNIEIAIAGFKVVATVATRDTFPENWAKVQNNLGVAYNDRIRGDRPDNLERAIAFYEAALQVCTREAFPEQWAQTQTNLGSAYLFRIRGDQVENLEKAIEFYKNALKVYNYERFPQEWADAQTNLGGTYIYRIRGDRADNLEKAITHCQKALNVHTLENYPRDWADAQSNLGVAYSERIQGQKEDNLEAAIRAYQAALQVHTYEEFPVGWARLQINLGLAYFQWKHGNRSDNIEIAIAAFNSALKVYKYSDFPERWANTHKYLGATYLARMRGNSKKNLQAAMDFSNSALKIYTPESFPKDWADVQKSLGVAYQTQEKFSDAIACYQLALKVYKPTTFPVNCLITGRLLGNVASAVKRWDKAIEGYSLAVEAVETNRTWATSDFRRQEIVAEAIDVYENMVHACINSGQVDKAIETVERSRSKKLVDLMASNDLYSGGEIPSEVQELLQQYEALQKQIDSERFHNGSESNRELMKSGRGIQNRAAFQAYSEAIAILETQKAQVFEQIRGLDPVLAGEIQVSPLEFAKMQKLIDRPTTAILSFYTTTDNTYIFVLRQNQSTPDLHTCMGEGIEILQNWIKQNWLQPYLNDKATWQSQLNDFLAELAQRLQINNLIDQHLQGIEELILVPHLLLHQIPLAALTIQDTEHSYLGDKFLIRYAPSCQVLEFCQERENRHPSGDSLNYGIVEDATEDLACASFEAEQIANLFNIPESQRLKGRSQATKSNYRQLALQVQLLHSCHHAQSRLDKPLESILQLANETLTLGELLTPGWRLPNLWDVFLSCCETNLGVPESLADEILTLSTGFLCAGARSVISTLWSVNDLATALFSIFYYQERQQGKSRPEALQQAQKKLRSLTQEDIKPLSLEVHAKRQEARKKRNQHPPSSTDYLKWNGEYRKYAGVTVQIDKVRTSLEDEPFSHPRYWAAFTCSGLR